MKRLVLILVLSGCAGSFAATKEACLGPVDTRAEAVRVAGPHIASAMVCAAAADTSDSAKACVTNEFEAMKATAKPVVYQCAVTLFSDVAKAAVEQ